MRNWSPVVKGSEHVKEQITAFGDIQSERRLTGNYIMQEQTTFLLSEDFLAQRSFDVSTLYQELNRNIKSVEDLLVSYHFKTRGRVFNIIINPNSLELLQPQIGKFLVNYTIGQFNACADVDFSEKVSMEMLIDLDPQNKKAIITGEYIPEREPDEF